MCLVDGCYYESEEGSQYCELHLEVAEIVPNTTLKEAFINYNKLFGKPDGGPQSYYDFPLGAITLNDLIEFKEMDFHRGNIFKACWRYGTKEGTSKDYDARKIIYSGARILMKLAGVKALRETLQKMLDDPQFQDRK